MGLGGGYGADNLDEIQSVDRKCVWCENASKDEMGRIYCSAVGRTIATDASEIEYLCGEGTACGGYSFNPYGGELGTFNERIR